MLSFDRTCKHRRLVFLVTLYNRSSHYESYVNDVVGEWWRSLTCFFVAGFFLSLVFFVPDTGTWVFSRNDAENISNNTDNTESDLLVYTI